MEESGSHTDLYDDYLDSKSPSKDEEKTPVAQTVTAQSSEENIPLGKLVSREASRQSSMTSLTSLPESDPSCVCKTIFDPVDPRKYFGFT